MAPRRPAGNVPCTETEERLLVEAAQKDPRKFGDLYELHFGRVYAFVARRIRHRDTAEDVTSEVFHRALANLRKFEWRGAPFASWLMRIAANLVADQLKRAAGPEGAAREISSREDAPELSVNPDTSADEHCARLFQLVDRLPKDQQRVIFKRFVEERSIREIAQQLGRTEGAVKQLQFRALQNLRDRMEGANA